MKDRISKKKSWDSFRPTYQNLQSLAKYLDPKAKLSIKGDEWRIYFNCNNDQYQGKWWVEFDSVDTFRVDCLLEKWANNKAKERRRYISKQFSYMRKTVKKAIRALYEKEGWEKTSDSLKRMLTFDPLTVMPNPEYNYQMTPFKSIAKLSDTPFINYYQGRGYGCAYIKNGKMVAFRYRYQYIDEPKDAKKYAVAFKNSTVFFYSVV